MTCMKFDTTLFMISLNLYFLKQNVSIYIQLEAIICMMKDLDNPLIHKFKDSFLYFKLLKINALTKFLLRLKGV